MLDTESLDKRTRERIEYARGLPGSIIVGLGPGGCGKTFTVLRVSLAAANLNGVDWFGYDANGDVMKTLEGIERFHQSEYEAATNGTQRANHWNKLRFVQRCKRNLWRGPTKLGALQATVKRWVESGLTETSSGEEAAKPRAALYIDEAGSVRDFDEDFWPAMRQARNARIGIFTTGHRLVDWHPSARANIRLLLLWKPADGRGYDVNGTKIKRELCADSGSPVVHYFVSGEDKPRIWDRDKHPDKYPVELITLPIPTVAKKIGF
jgi:hypothetical protein